MGQRHGHREDAEVSETELLALVCCDLAAIVRGRSLAAEQLAEHLHTGIGWVPANHALTALGPLAEPNPFGSTGDLRLLPDPATRMRVSPSAEAPALELILCDLLEIDGRPWECCPRRFLRDALADMEREFDIRVAASFEHEFQLMRDDVPVSLPFSLEAQRRAEPFATNVMDALTQADVRPERFFPEFAAHQFEIPVAPANGLAAADRAVILREVVREVARREGMRATFVPLLNPDEAGNGVHIHISLIDAAGSSLLFDAGGAGALSEVGERFAAGILKHARALTALTAASPVSAMRLQPHRWSAGAVCLGRQNREALLRLPPLVTLAGADPAAQLRLEYRGADASANPYLALGALIRAGLEGLRAQLPAPPILEEDPAGLDAAGAERFGLGALPASLEEALGELERDEAVRAWLPPLLYDAYASVKRAELAAVSELDLADVCRRYAGVY
ncbi:MAG: glutamine synthetase [Solirubrobacteraceae bacterium]|nr:glutamine synthetase [Solirubrobacteraceae bacterium]